MRTHVVRERRPVIDDLSHAHPHSRSKRKPINAVRRAYDRPPLVFRNGDNRFLLRGPLHTRDSQQSLIHVVQRSAPADRRFPERPKHLGCRRRRRQVGVQCVARTRVSQPPVHIAAKRPDRKFPPPVGRGRNHVGKPAVGKWIDRQDDRPKFGIHVYVGTRHPAYGGHGRGIHDGRNPNHPGRQRKHPMRPVRGRPNAIGEYLPNPLRVRRASAVRSAVPVLEQLPRLYIDQRDRHPPLAVHGRHRIDRHALFGLFQVRVQLRSRRLQPPQYAHQSFRLLKALKPELAHQARPAIRHIQSVLGIERGGHVAASSSTATSYSVM